MIDFNDIANPPMADCEGSREGVRKDLLNRLEPVLMNLFPAGKVKRGKFLIGDILGSPGDSLEVVLTGEKAGLWTDRVPPQGAQGEVHRLPCRLYGSVRQMSLRPVRGFVSRTGKCDV